MRWWPPMLAALAVGHLCSHRSLRRTPTPSPSTACTSSSVRLLALLHPHWPYARAVPLPAPPRPTAHAAPPPSHLCHSSHRAALPVGPPCPLRPLDSGHRREKEKGEKVYLEW